MTMNARGCVSLAMSEGVLLIVLNGSKGSGFSLQFEMTDTDVVGMVAEALDSAAADIRKLGAELAAREARAARQ